MQTLRTDRFEGLHVLADDDPRWGSSPVEQARAACAGGAAVIQLRIKHVGDRRALEWAREIRELTRETDRAFVMNDRFDLAVLSGADGVHLGQEDLPPGAIPPDLRRRLSIGRSTHTLGQVEAARREPLDYVAFGPVFGTTSKASAYDARGLESLREAVRLSAPRALIAIGGITAQHLTALREAGVAGFAVISGVAGAADPVAATRALVSGFTASTGLPG